MFEFRYSQVLNQVYVTMMYSAGIPLLYPVSMISFFMTYWVDKYLFIRYYKNPPQYTMAMAERTVSLMRYSLAIHFIIGFLMLSNSQILTSNNKEQLEKYVENNKYFVFAEEKYQSAHIVIYILCFIGLLFFYVFLANIMKLISCVNNCCASISKALNLDGLEVNAEDYYKECSLSTLKKEFKNAKAEFTKISNDKATGVIQEAHSE